MGTWVFDLDCCVRDLRVSEEKLGGLKRQWPDVNDWQEKPSEDGAFSIDPMYGDGTRLFTDSQPWSFADDVARLIAECEPGSVIDLYVEDDFTFVRIAKTQDGGVLTEWRDAVNPFEARCC